MESRQRNNPQAPSGGSFSNGSESFKTPGSEYGKADTSDVSDRRTDNRQYQPVYQQQQRQNAVETSQSYLSSTSSTPPLQATSGNQGPSPSANAPTYTPTNNSSFQPSTGNNYQLPSSNQQSTTATISYQPTATTPSSYQPTTTSYQPTSTPTAPNGQSAYQPPTNSATYPSQSAGQAAYQPSYQGKPAPPQLKTETSSNNITPARQQFPPPASAAAPLQRQQSTLNTSQRPYQQPISPSKPPVAVTTPKPATAATPRSAPYTPSSQSYQSYQNAPATRAPSSQTTANYTTARPATQRAPASPNAYGSGNYSSTSAPKSPGYGPEAGRWGTDSARPAATRSYNPNYTMDEDPLPMYKETPLVAAEGLDDKTALQSKFKAMLRAKQPEQAPAQFATPPTGSFDPSRPLVRKNSEVKIPAQLTKQGSGYFPEAKVADAIPETKSSLLNDPALDDDDDDDDDDFVVAEPKFLPMKSTVEKPDNQVSQNIKFFEQNDKAKVPLAPKTVTAEKKEKPVRPTHIDIISNLNEPNDYESGVDVSPVKHPNLKSIGNPPRKVARIRSASASRYSRASYPGTPTRAVSAPSRSTPNTPKKQKPPLRFKPEDELIDFFRGSEYEHQAAKENRPVNGVTTPKKTPSKLPMTTRKTPTTPLKSPSTAMSLPKTPENAPTTPLIKKVPMNKIQVGAAPSPNIRAVKSKIGSLANTTHKPGGGNVKIESHKLSITAQSRIAAKNDTYAPSGGDKKIQHVKLQWNAKSKVGSLDNAAYKPGGGEKKIESVKLDFKEKAKPKVGSKENSQHIPGGGDVKIHSQKLEFKAQSKVGSLDNVKHKPSGGDVKIFDDKSYMKQMASASGSGTQKNCDLAIVSEVRGVNVSGEEATDISIEKTTTIAAVEPNMSKTTKVTVVTRSPSKERRGMTRTPSTHEVKLTYSTVSSPAHATQPSQKPVQVVRVPAVEHAPILNPSVGETESRPPLPSLLSSADDSKVTKEASYKNEPEIKKESTEKKSDSTVEVKSRSIEEVKPEKETPIARLLQNEAATHEKVGEIWKEVQNAQFPVNEVQKPTSGPIPDRGPLQQSQPRRNPAQPGPQPALPTQPYQSTQPAGLKPNQNISQPQTQLPSQLPSAQSQPTQILTSQHQQPTQLHSAQSQQPSILQTSQPTQLHSTQPRIQLQPQLQQSTQPRSSPQPVRLSTPPRTEYSQQQSRPAFEQQRPGAEISRQQGGYQQHGGSYK